jgi:hypothetical protein
MLSNHQVAFNNDSLMKLNKSRSRIHMNTSTNLKLKVIYFLVLSYFMFFIPSPVLSVNCLKITANTKHRKGNNYSSKPIMSSLSERDGWAMIEAESCDSLGPIDMNNKDGILTYIADNPWAKYVGVDLHNETNYIHMSAANGGETSAIQMLVDDSYIDTLIVKNTGAWNNFQTKTYRLKIPQSGVRNVKFNFIIGSTNIDWFVFSSDSTISPWSSHLKPRVVISSDFPPIDVCMSGCASDHTSDPDDIQSMIRFLLYTNNFDVEGLVASSATFANIAKKKNILDVLDLYDQVDENLRKHDPLFPTADYLRSVTFQGRSGTWGKSVSNNIGEGKDSEASNAIISIVDKADPRPIWFCFWGDCSNLAQAIWKVRNTRSAAELQIFLSKIRVYQIAHQDETIDWLMSNFPNLFIIYTEATFMGIFGGHEDQLGNLNWINTNIRQDHGPLGAIYPPAAMNVDGLKEGDTPSFLYLVSAIHGMNDPEDPTQESWGGQYVRSSNTNHWVDGIGGSTISRWKSQYQAEFAERANWMRDSISTQVPNLKNTKGDNSVSVYPIPTKNELNVISEIEFDTLIIFDINGKLILEKSFNEKIKKTTLQINFNEGIYLIKLSTSRFSGYSKFIIE